VAQPFVLLRLGSMRGLDGNLFDFDYDLTWIAIVFSPEGTVLGRFGGRDDDMPGKYHSLKGLRYSLEQAIERYRRGGAPAPKKAPAELVEEYPAGQSLPRNACIHCHHVYEFRRDARQAAKTWTRDELWVYPQPKNIGLALDVNQGNRITGVAPGTPAARLGLCEGDVLTSLDTMPVASIADVQAALHAAPAKGKIAARWLRQRQPMQGQIELAAGWKITDLSWRRSLKSLAPAPGVQGYDLTVEEKRDLGLAPGALAFRQHAFVSPEAQQAGVRINDVIVGVNEHRPTMTARQFEAFIRLTYQPREVIHLHVLRGKERLELSMKLAN
jgi:hypothetical protein